MIKNGLTLEGAQAKLHRLQNSQQTRRWYASAHAGRGASRATRDVEIHAAMIEQARELTDFIRREQAIRARRARPVRIGRGQPRPSAPRT